MNAVITNPLNLFIIIIGSFLGLTLGLFLLLNKSAKNRANIFLGLLVLAIVSYFIPAFLYRFGLDVSFPHFHGLSKIVGFLIGPLAYLYVRACTQKGFQVRPILWLHFLPFCFDLLYQSPYFIQPGAEKIEEFLTFVKTGELNQHPWLFIVKSLHGCFYFILSFKLILQYRKHLSNSASSIDAAFHRWLLFFIIILVIPILGLIVFTFTDYQRVLIQIALLCFLTFILAIYSATLVKPQLFHSFPHQMPIPESAEEQKQKYENSKLQTIQKDKYIKKLVEYVEREKPYTTAELTLAQLSEKVKIPAHYLSQVINEKLDCNFLDFINGYRVKEAQKKLIDPKFSHFTILSIAYDAGFNSKSTFYTAFKKQTGITPSQYRKSLVG